MAIDELGENDQQYLIQLFEQTKGDTAAQVSMYDVGEGLGMDHDTSARVAETLIGLQLAEMLTPAAEHFSQARHQGRSPIF